MTVTIMITTRDRRADLRRTLERLELLSPRPDEVIVTADGCTDGTVEMIRSGFPHVRILINPSGLGSVASRHRMIYEATGDLVLSLDDDSYPEAADCLSVLRDLFSAEPKLAVAHFPQRTDEYPETLSQRDFGPVAVTSSYPNSGACYRRAVYLQLPGFPPFFFHAFEEPDYAIQCLAAGWDVLYYPDLIVRHHYTGVMRNELRTHRRHARNECWSILLRCPWPVVPYRLLYTIASQARYASRRGFAWLLTEPGWWWAAVKGVSQCLRSRHPVSWSGYRRWVGAQEWVRQQGRIARAARASG